MISPFFNLIKALNVKLKCISTSINSLKNLKNLRNNLIEFLILSGTDVKMKIKYSDGSICNINNKEKITCKP